MKKQGFGSARAWMTINIDSNCANGPTASGGALFPNSSCIVK